MTPEYEWVMSHTREGKRVWKTRRIDDKPPRPAKVSTADTREMLAIMRATAPEPKPGDWIPLCVEHPPLEDEEWLPSWDELLPGERLRARAMMALMNEDWNPALAQKRARSGDNWFGRWLREQVVDVG